MMGDRATVWALACVPAVADEVLRFPLTLPSGVGLFADGVMFHAESDAIFLTPAAVKCVFDDATFRLDADGVTIIGPALSFGFGGFCDRPRSLPDPLFIAGTVNATLTWPRDYLPNPDRIPGLSVRLILHGRFTPQDAT